MDRLPTERIDRRVLKALLRAFVAIDLRGQHYAAATATKPTHIISPLFWVVGQCLTASAVTSLLLFARVDVFFFAFANLSLSLLILATTLFVEFQEVVFNEEDVHVLGYRPMRGGTYSAARYGNLLFYVGLMYAALNVIPMIVGAGLRDAGAWFLPVYFVVSASATLILVAALILLLSWTGGNRFGTWKSLFAWTQIVLILVVGYGGQFMLRDRTYRVQMWAASPPGWVTYLPTYWLARIVEGASVAPRVGHIWLALGLIAGALCASAATVLRLHSLYAHMQPAARIARTYSAIAARGQLLGGVFRFLIVGADERIGFWFGKVRMAREPGLVMRCVLAFNMPLALMVLGGLLDQFRNPLEESEVVRTALPILSVYLFVLAVPAAVYQLSFSKDDTGSWLLRQAPLEEPVRFVSGVCGTLMLLVVTPLAIAYTFALQAMWGDPLSAALHGGLAWIWSWPALWAGVWLLLEGVPFALPPARGSGLGIPPLPLAMMYMVAGSMMTVHFLCAWSWLFWIGSAAAALASYPLLRNRAAARMARRWRSA